VIYLSCHWWLHLISLCLESLSFPYFLFLQVLSMDKVNENVKNTKYEVRGEIYLAAVKRVEAGKKVIYTNVGNPQALGQKPLTFPRQVLSLMMAPFVLEDPMAAQLYPPDAIERAKRYMGLMKNAGLGAYSDSKGHMFIRKEIASFIEKGCGGAASCDPNHIFCSNGASECVRTLLNVSIQKPTDGIMVPIPQYPLYSAAIALLGGQLVPYYLDEKAGWALSVPELQRSVDAARAKGIYPYLSISIQTYPNCL
jgi:glutamate--glyoxylate aminotransferase